MAWFGEVRYPMNRASQQPAPYLAACVPVRGDGPPEGPVPRGHPSSDEGFFVWSPRWRGASPSGDNREEAMENQAAEKWDPRAVQDKWLATWNELRLFEASDDPADTRPR